MKKATMAKVELRIDWSSKVLRAFFTVIYPEEADYILEHLNTHNRAFKPRAMARYAADMARGWWAVNGEAIKFEKSGALLDGQNRLGGSRNADSPFETLVVLGLEKDSQRTMDSHVKRTIGDALKLEGELNYKALAATISMHLKWKTGRNVANSADVLSPKEALDWLNKHPNLRVAVSRYGKSSKPLGIPHSVLGAFGYEAGVLDGWATADNFWNSIHDGVGLSSGDPCLALREWFIKRMAKPEIKGKPSAAYCLAVTIKAWNAFVRGVSIHRLYWQTFGKGAESFPEMVRDIY